MGVEEWVGMFSTQYLNKGTKLDIFGEQQMGCSFNT